MNAVASMPRLFRSLVIVCLSAGSFALVSCSSDPARGYSFRPTIGGDAETISVPVFENRTYAPGIEAELTEAIIKELQRTTTLRVTNARSADTTLSGSVTRTDMQRISLNSTTGLVQELAVRVTVDFQWKDNRTGKPLVARRNFTAVDSFAPARGTGEQLEDGRHSATQQLARDIVAELRGQW